MIAEITILLASAEKAFGLVEKALKHKKTISSAMSELDAFYSVKDKIDKQTDEVKLKGGDKYNDLSLDSYAMKVYRAQEATADYEKRIKKMFSDAGKTSSYYKMIDIRESEKQRRLDKAKRERAERIRKEKKAKEIREISFALILLALVLGAGGWFIGLVMSIL